jgi:hypothetical protein
MDTYIQTALGILVSVLLFLIGYRQTVGARKERVSSANEKLVETILRRIILEGYIPQRKDIGRIIEGKARDYKIRVKDILSIDQIINTLYTRIFENDLISKDEREANLEKFSIHFEHEKDLTKPEVEFAFSHSRDRNKKFLNIIIISLGIMSSIIGVSLAYIDKLTLFNFNEPFNYTIVGSMLASLLAISVSYIFLRFKDSQESSEDSAGSKKPLLEYAKFEREVQNQLKKLRIPYEIPSQPDSGFNLVATIKGKKTAIEIRDWKNRPPLNFINILVRRMNLEMKQSGIEKGIFVVKNSFDLGPDLRFSDDIKIITISELKKSLN